MADPSYYEDNRMDEDYLADGYDVEVYNNRYRIEAKLGWGHFSTVWLATDLTKTPFTPESYVAIKFQRSEQSFFDAAQDEIKLLKAAQVDTWTKEFIKQLELNECPYAPKDTSVVKLLDTFNVRGKNGMHFCMVFENMGPNILTLNRRYKNGIPLDLARKIALQLLAGCCQLHAQNIIHTDIKLENVLVTSPPLPPPDEKYALRGLAPMMLNARQMQDYELAFQEVTKPVFTSPEREEPVVDVDPADLSGLSEVDDAPAPSSAKVAAPKKKNKNKNAKSFNASALEQMKRQKEQEKAEKEAKKAAKQNKNKEEQPTAASPSPSPAPGLTTEQPAQEQEDTKDAPFPVEEEQPTTLPVSIAAAEELASEQQATLAVIEKDVQVEDIEPQLDEEEEEQVAPMETAAPPTAAPAMEIVVNVDDVFETPTDEEGEQVDALAASFKKTLTVQPKEEQPVVVAAPAPPARGYEGDSMFLEYHDLLAAMPKRRNSDPNLLHSAEADPRLTRDQRELARLKAQARLPLLYAHGETNLGFRVLNYCSRKMDEAVGYFEQDWNMIPRSDFGKQIANENQIAKMQYTQALNQQALHHHHQQQYVPNDSETGEQHYYPSQHVEEEEADYPQQMEEDGASYEAQVARVKAIYQASQQLTPEQRAELRKQRDALKKDVKVLMESFMKEYRDMSEEEARMHACEELGVHPDDLLSPEQILERDMKFLKEQQERKALLLQQARAMPAAPATGSRRKQGPTKQKEETLDPILRHPMTCKGKVYRSFFAGKKRADEWFEHPDAEYKLVDLGNGCWTTHHFNETIQTRQYRSPEVLLGYPYNVTADVWSVACTVFELVTGDYLFDPQKTDDFSKNDDHLAQILELVGPTLPEELFLKGKYSRTYFASPSQMHKIAELNFWPLKAVLMERYKFPLHEAEAFASFLEPMLRIHPDERAQASQLLDHPWLHMKSPKETSGYRYWLEQAEIAKHRAYEQERYGHDEEEEDYDPLESGIDTDSDYDGDDVTESEYTESDEDGSSFVSGATGDEEVLGGSQNDGFHDATSQHDEEDEDA